ncbi:hypothetical protein TNCV_1290021 [Trichonephila clavipes]|nr:hypothetical protein TNCV_1290021 [Trichonephila clavipes]
MTRIDQQKRCCVSSGPRQATNFCSDSPQSLGVWLGSFYASTIKSGPGTKRLPPFSRIAKLPEGKEIRIKRRLENRLLEFFANKDQYFYERGIMKLPVNWQQIIQQNTVHI